MQALIARVPSFGETVVSRVWSAPEVLVFSSKMVPLPQTVMCHRMQRRRCLLRLLLDGGKVLCASCHGVSHV